MEKKQAKFLLMDKAVVTLLIRSFRDACAVAVLFRPGRNRCYHGDRWHGILAGSALVLILIQYFGDKKIVE